MALTRAQIVSNDISALAASLGIEPSQSTSHKASNQRCRKLCKALLRYELRAPLTAYMVGELIYLPSLGDSIEEKFLGLNQVWDSCSGDEATFKQLQEGPAPSILNGPDESEIEEQLFVVPEKGRKVLSIKNENGGDAVVPSSSKTPRNISPRRFNPEVPSFEFTPASGSPTAASPEMNVSNPTPQTSPSFLALSSSPSPPAAVQKVKPTDQTATPSATTSSTSTPISSPRSSQQSSTVHLLESLWLTIGSTTFCCELCQDPPNQAGIIHLQIDGMTGIIRRCCTWCLIEEEMAEKKWRADVCSQILRGRA